MTPLAIGPDTVVTLSYELFDEDNDVVDRATTGEPLTYVHGYAQIVPGLEKQLAGLRPGDRGSFTVEPEEAFGEHDDDAVVKVDREEFPKGQDVAAGDAFEAEGPGGEPMVLRVLEVHDDCVVVDFNHPLAGQRIRFEVEIAEVRAATDAEIEEAQAELEQRIDEEMSGCCDGHDHDHDHDHAHAQASELVQMSKKHSS